MNSEDWVKELRSPRARLAAILFLRLSALVVLAWAVYIAYTMYQYRDGWNAGVAYMEALNKQNLIAPCYTNMTLNPNGV